MQTVFLSKQACYKLEHLNRNFVWGGVDITRKCHSIAWDKFCMPKKEGGLGFRDLYQFNKAFIMKLGWGIIHDLSKYKCSDLVIPSLHVPNKAFDLWRSIGKVWDSVENNCSWLLGDGRYVKFWWDR
uniref:Ribonuclease H protein At1g65750 family n=1 Tax=Cajanus cajan TaxID=3821 RepID=A0A151RLJ2_CAJCA|nr:Putative ribonuclease H protein At1g65750 family [Cajanus cajan]